MHRGLLDELGSDPALVRSGISAAREYSADILGGEELEGYVGVAALPSLQKRFALTENSSGAVLLHVVENENRVPRREDVVSPIVVALDLMESIDSRSRRAGRELLERLLDDRATG